MEIYLIRHAQSTNNRGDTSLPDPPLSDTGEAQARVAAEAFREIQPTALYCSPMRRNLQTTRPIAEATGLRPRPYAELCEYGGMWATTSDERVVPNRGMTRREILEICPTADLNDEITEEGWWFEQFTENGAHVLEQATRAVRATLDLFRERHANERITVVTHGRSGSIFLAVALGVEPNTDYAQFSHNNCGMSRFDETGGEWKLRFLNRIDHVPPELVTA